MTDDHALDRSLDVDKTGLEGVKAGELIDQVRKAQRREFGSGAALMWCRS